MLDRHLIAKTDPKSKADSFIYWQNYRITVLFDELFRIEKSKDKIFNDKATQSIWFRNKIVPEFEILESDDFHIKVKTNKVTLVLINSVSIIDSFILIKNRKIYLDNEGNLKGTYRTLDAYDGKYFVGFDRKGNTEIKLDNGVASLSGVSVIDDSKSLILDDDGKLKSALKDHEDYYVFAYGHNYREALKALFELTGYTPLLPRYAFGNWWSRYHEYNDKEYMSTLYKFINHNVPITVSTIDMDWHYNSNNLDKAMHIEELHRNTPFYGGKDGWTGYTWNKDLFPDYKGFLKEINNLGFHVTINLHPALGIRWFEDCYNDFALAMGKDVKSGEQIKFDITDDNFINNYFKIIHKPYENDGVSFYWIDWQQGTSSKVEGLDPLWSLNHYHYLDNAYNHDKGLILSRYAGIGSNRYPVGFSGDTISSWKTLQYISEFTSKSSNVGYTYWSHDIGGHFGGKLDYQLYTRFVQFGVFSPINRLHSSNMPIISKEPWYFLNGCGDIAMDFLRLRHRLIPYLYSYSYRTHLEGLALIEPLYYENSNKKKSYKYPNEYIFAQDGFIIPITTPLNKDGYALVKGYVPKGRYFDFFTHDIYEEKKDKEITFARTLESMPYLVKAGSFISLNHDKLKYNEVSNPNKLMLITSIGNGSLTLYEDENKNISKTYFKNNVIDYKTLQLSISFNNSNQVFHHNRIFTFDYVDIETANIKVYKNNKNYENYKILYADNLKFEIEVDNESTYLIEISFNITNRFIEISKILQRILYTIVISTDDKYKVLDEISKQSNIEDLYNAIKNNQYLNKSQKLRLLEIF